jgi:hypothetical protein
MRSEVTAKLLQTIRHMGHEKFLGAIFEEANMKQLDRWQALADRLCPERTLMREAADAMVRFGRTPEEALKVAEQVFREMQNGPLDAGKFIHRCFRVSAENNLDRKRDDYDHAKPE